MASVINATRCGAAVSSMRATAGCTCTPSRISSSVTRSSASAAGTGPGRRWPIAGMALSACVSRVAPRAIASRVRAKSASVCPRATRMPRAARAAIASSAPGSSGASVTWRIRPGSADSTRSTKRSSGTRGRRDRALRAARARGRGPRGGRRGCRDRPPRDLDPVELTPQDLEGGGDEAHERGRGAVATVGGDAGRDGIRPVVEGVPAAAVHVQVDQAGGERRPVEVDVLVGVRGRPEPTAAISPSRTCTHAPAGRAGRRPPGRR